MINTGLNAQDLKLVVDRLSHLLSNEYILYTKTLKYHWNVEGKHFGALHAFFKEQYEQLFVIIDDVAERIRALGHISPATLQEFLKLTSLTEEAGKNPHDLGMIEDLLRDHETIIRHLRDDIELTEKVRDAGTNNFLADRLEQHEKMAWMLRAHVLKNG